VVGWGFGVFDGGADAFEEVRSGIFVGWLMGDVSMVTTCMKILV
jgi:hypothetical protein